MSILKKYIDKLQSRKYLQKDRNSITVDDITIDFPLVFDGNGKMYFFKLDRYVYLKGTRYTKADGKTRDFLMTCLFKRGFMSDGASAPSFAQWLVPDIKKGNRKSELALREAEIWGAAASAKKNYQYPLEKMDAAWKKLLLNQFHDILLGQ